MDKKGILEKAQTESVDEGLENAQNKADYGAFSHLCLFMSPSSE